MRRRAYSRGKAMPGSQNVYKTCHIMFTLHINDLTVTSGGGGEGGRATAG